MTKWCEIRPIFTPFCQYGLVRIRSLRTGTHHWSNNAWTGADEFPENKSRRTLIFDPLGRRDSGHIRGKILKIRALRD